MDGRPGELDGEVCSAMATQHAARAPEVHVASYHEVRVRRSGDHVKQSQPSDGLSTNANLMMWDLCL